MPYNPVKKFPEVIRQLKDDGFFSQVSISTLESTTMRTMGIINDKTLSQTIRAMEKTGYIKRRANGQVFDILNPDATKKEPTPETTENIEQAEMDKILYSEGGVNDTTNKPGIIPGGETKSDADV